MSKLTLEEKRLQQIRMQLFGKDRPNPQTKAARSGKVTEEKTAFSKTVSAISHDHTTEGVFLKKDLMKVMLLSFVTIGSQLVLYYLSLQGIIDLNVFHLF